jgi:hypothetical protein
MLVERLFPRADTASGSAGGKKVYVDNVIAGRNLRHRNHPLRRAAARRAVVLHGVALGEC